MTKILVAEDEQDILELLEFALQHAGFEVVCVTNGKEAIDEAKNAEPDLILLDIRMPYMSGLDACKLLKSDPKTKEIPIVFLSAKGQKSEIMEGFEAGAIDYLLKPFSPDYLNKRIREILEGAA
ncbi:MAG TPA: response regulator [Anaerolineaceae bacterium]|nr:response regulator [Anaerolineaceae bacterium]